jgi:hypothetical protein
MTSNPPTELDCFANRDPICPHCGHVFRDAWDLDLDDEQSTDTECGECERTFRIICHVKVTYTTKKP